MPTKPFDPSIYLETPQDIAEYVRGCLEADDYDAQFLASVLGDVARSKGMTEIADRTGLAREALYRSLSDTGNPSLDTLLKVLKALGLKFTVEPVAGKDRSEGSLAP